ncbi:MAG: hypothetical protein AB1898_04570 [Acidobacteriota bacterium]
MDDLELPTFDLLSAGVRGFELSERCAGVFHKALGLVTELGTMMHRRYLVSCLLKITAVAWVFVGAAHGQPVDAIGGILSAFEEHSIVAVGEGHRLEQDKTFLLSLIARPGFAAKVDDIVVEFGNSLHQPTLDRYMAGRAVPLTELRRVWADTTVVNGLWHAPVYERFFAAVRERNQSLPKKQKIRVLACDPPIDWAKVRTLNDAAPFLSRDSFCAAVLEREVLAKGRTALVVMGDFHISRRHVTGRPLENAITFVEGKHPGSAFVVLTYFGQFRDSAMMEERLATGPIPSLSLLRGTWLGGLPNVGPKPPTRTRVGGGRSETEQVVVTHPPQLEEVADALLYLGPKSIFTRSLPSAERFSANELHELQRRHQLLFGMALDTQVLYK